MKGGNPVVKLDLNFQTGHGLKANKMFLFRKGLSLKKNMYCSPFSGTISLINIFFSFSTLSKKKVAYFEWTDKYFLLNKTYIFVTGYRLTHLRSTHFEWTLITKIHSSN